MADPADAELRRLIPSVDSALQQTDVHALALAHGRSVVRGELRRVLDQARARQILLASLAIGIAVSLVAFVLPL